MSSRAKTITFTLVVMVAGVITWFVVLMQPIPFVEGDTIVTTGGQFGFQIGMNKTECLRVIDSRYRANGNTLVVWSPELQFYTKFPVARVSGVTTTLQNSPRWDITMPADWVNTIYLSFQDGRLVSIRKSRWLYERP